MKPLPSGERNKGVLLFSGITTLIVGCGFLKGGQKGTRMEEGRAIWNFRGQRVLGFHCARTSLVG